ncbi:MULTISPECIES: hypothetical protein [unclassified Bradyrhizobium]|uniref:hypothetical protein n=1 Tax=unclassified Bradyrhizobium TaxID=2631580 RepID=UPI0028F0E91E|nr:MULTISPECIES: hypothetical protein [unclassified Bradyrhizobium]
MTETPKRSASPVPDPAAHERYKLDEHDQFTVPKGGTYKLDLANRCVVAAASGIGIAPFVFSGAMSSDALAAPSYIPRRLTDEMLQQILSPDIQTRVFKSFDNIGTLHAHVPKIAELSRTMKSFGEAAPYFVLTVGAKDHKDVALKADAETALRGHGVDAHIHIV